jgi:hypothetical protein
MSLQRLSLQRAQSKAIVIEKWACHSDRSAAAKPQAQWRNLLFPRADVPAGRHRAS